MYFVQSRTRQRVPQGPQRSIAHGVVIRIKQVAKCGMEGAIVLLVSRQKKSLEEPGGVRQVPLGGTCVGHRLQTVIFNAQGSANSQRSLPHGQVFLQ